MRYSAGYYLSGFSGFISNSEDILLAELSAIYHESKNVKIQGQGLTSDRTVKCLTNVEAFSLDAKDIEEVTTHFARFLRSPRVQQVIRYQSPYWRSLAANRIQVAWRSRKKRLRRANTTQNYYQTLRKSENIPKKLLVVDHSLLCVFPTGFPAGTFPDENMPAGTSSENGAGKSACNCILDDENAHRTMNVIR
ncbi:cyclic nucleotide gated channel protein, putative [Medicago truncatula]|uniref:Cyclic nucleotide gated channel protein, putative n=1 Tax=Medicago truncatula TaxID=3880 RepID=A0A072UAL8_MEDTR|nr:cyclic nucleotide gated channel protein, putative [Medicago truncatula]